MAPKRGLLLLLCVLAYLRWVDCVSVMSVDFGSEWMKVAIVSPGVPMEIALNKESKRKTPAYISFRNGERTFGEDAQNVAVKFPAKAYGYLLDLLAKKIDHPVVELYKKRFPWYNIVADPERGTIIFKHDEDLQFTPEELIGQLLHKAKEFAEESAGQPITDAVIIVPGFFNQAERLAMLQAGKLAGLKVLQLINDYTAVSLNYGIFRRKDFNETAQYIMFYDMGASSTTATLVSYQIIKTKDRGIVESNPQAAILGVGHDRTLGGLEIQLRLQKFLAQKFNDVKKTKSDVFSNARAMAKLFKEAGRLKNVLSANADHHAQVEGLLDEEDFKVKVTREELEELSKDLFPRVEGPIKKALDSAGVTMDIVNQVILVGGGTRVPFVQEALTKFVQRELGKNINADEAAVMGAAYKAADISTGFKVKKFITKDAVLFPIQVSYERTTDSGEVKQQKRTLFGFMNSFPQKKMITFNKYSKDFGFLVHYGELDHFSPEEAEALGAKDLMQVSLTGVEDAVNKHAGPNADPKGIKAHFTLDESGVLSLTNVDYIVEKTGGAEPSTLEKIGSSFSQMFGSGKKAVEEQKETDQPPEAETSAEAEEKRGGDAASEVKDDGAKNETAETPLTDDKTSMAGNGTDKAKTEKPKPVIVKEEIKSSIEILGVKNMSPSQWETSQKKIDELNEADKQKHRKEKARNQLESFLFDLQSKIELDNFIAAATPEEKVSISRACSEISTWLDDEGYDADAVTYEDKSSQLKSLANPLLRRVHEHEERPEAVKALTAKLEAATGFAKAIREKTQTAVEAGEETIFTTVEIDVLDKLIADSKEWSAKMVEEQKKLALSAAPVLTIRSLVEKMAALDREVNYLMNKAKIWRPTKKVNDTKTDSKSTKDNVTNSETKDETLKPEIVIDASTKEGSTPAVGEETLEPKIVIEEETTPDVSSLDDIPAVENSNKPDTDSSKSDIPEAHQEL